MRAAVAPVGSEQYRSRVNVRTDAPPHEMTKNLGISSNPSYVLGNSVLSIHKLLTLEGNNRSSTHPNDAWRVCTQLRELYGLEATHGYVAPCTRIPMRPIFLPGEAADKWAAKCSAREQDPPTA